MERIAFSLGSLRFTWYGILVVSGFIAGLWLAERRSGRDRIAPEVVADLGLWLMAGGIIGARVWFVVAYWREEFAGYPWWETVAIYRGGLVFYGGLIGASLVTVFYARAKAVPLWKLADVLAPSIALGQACGRVGCFLYGCCYGSVCFLPWAVHYPDLPPQAPGTGLHPTQLYEAGLDLMLYGALAWQYRHKQFSGHTFAAYLIAYGALRFAVEFLRGDYPVRYLGGWATPGQVGSIIAVATGVLIWKMRRAAETHRPA
jgi:phosphatidylglycerol:prolipoprotein diacylglycerol transferase